METPEEKEQLQYLNRLCLISSPISRLSFIEDTDSRGTSGTAYNQFTS